MSSTPLMTLTPEQLLIVASDVCWSSNFGRVIANAGQERTLYDSVNVIAFTWIVQKFLDLKKFVSKV